MTANNLYVGTGSSSATYASYIPDITSFDINIDKIGLDESETVPWREPANLCGK